MQLLVLGLVFGTGSAALADEVGCDTWPQVLNDGSFSGHPQGLGFPADGRVGFFLNRPLEGCAWTWQVELTGPDGIESFSVETAYPVDWAFIGARLEPSTVYDVTVYSPTWPEEQVTWWFATSADGHYEPEPVEESVIQDQLSISVIRQKGGTNLANVVLVGTAQGLGGPHDLIRLRNRDGVAFSVDPTIPLWSQHGVYELSGDPPEEGDLLCVDVEQLTPTLDVVRTVESCAPVRVLDRRACRCDSGGPATAVGMLLGLLALVWRRRTFPAATREVKGVSDVT